MEWVVLLALKSTIKTCQIRNILQNNVGILIFLSLILWTFGYSFILWNKLFDFLPFAISLRFFKIFYVLKGKILYLVAVLNSRFYLILLLDLSLCINFLTFITSLPEFEWLALTCCLANFTQLLRFYLRFDSLCIFCLYQ